MLHQVIKPTPWRGGGHFAKVEGDVAFDGRIEDKYQEWKDQ